MKYREALRLDKTVRHIKKKLEAGTATHRELSRLASVSGQIAGVCMAEQLRTDFPNGQVSGEDVRRIISPIMKENHRFVTEMAVLLQNMKYQEIGVGLKASPPDYNIDRENELVEEISRRSFEDGFFG